MQLLTTSFPEAGTKTSLLAEMEEGSRISVFKQRFFYAIFDQSLTTTFICEDLRKFPMLYK